jgi:hypothetical protein
VIGAPSIFKLIRKTAVFVYYKSTKGELKIRGIYECRCDERLQTKTKEFKPQIKRLTYTGLVLELEHLKIETRLIDEKFANAMGEYVTLADVGTGCSTFSGEIGFFCFPKCWVTCWVTLSPERACKHEFEILEGLPVAEYLLGDPKL